MATNPTYAANPRAVDWVQVTTANTNRDGSGSPSALCQGSAAGLKITSIQVQATGTTTAGMVRIFLSTDSGSTWRLFDEFPVGAVTPSASLPAYRASKNYTDLVLFGTAVRLAATTHNTETFNVFAFGADL